MPYTIFMLDDSLIISRNRFKACLDAIYAYHRKVNPDIEYPGGIESFLANSDEEKLVAAMKFFNWTPVVAEDGVIGLGTEALIRRGDPSLLEVVAPYVDADSAVEYIGEDGSAEKFEFDGKTVAVYRGKIAYGK